MELPHDLFVLYIHLICGYFRSIAQLQCVQCTDIWLYCWWLTGIVDGMWRSPSFSVYKKQPLLVMFKLGVGTVDVQFHGKQYAGWESFVINGREGKKEFWLPEQLASNKDFPLFSWKFCCDTDKMLFSLTPNIGPVLPNTWVCAERSNM